MRGHATSQLAGRCSGLQPTLGARDSRQRRGRAVVHLGWSGQRHECQRERCAKVSTFRRILPFWITEPEQVNGYTQPPRDIPSLINCQCLAPAQNLRYPAL